jgi:hypothetical protein
MVLGILLAMGSLAPARGGFAVLEGADFADALQRIGRAMR